MKVTDEIIINYLDGMLSDTERKLFEIELESNESLKEQVTLFKEGEEMFSAFSEYYFKEDDINYEALKHTAFAKKSTKSKPSNNVSFKNIFKKITFGISVTQLSGALASLFFAYMVGSYAPIPILQQSSEWTLVEQNYKALDESFEKHNIREWQVLDQGVLLSLKAIPGLDVSKSFYLENHSSVPSGHKIFLFIQSSKYDLLVTHKESNYNLIKGENIQAMLDPKEGRNDIFLVVKKNGSEKILKFTFNIIKEKK